MARPIVPARHQPSLPLERLLCDDAPGPDAVPLDVLIVGGGPAGLACAIELARRSHRAGDPAGGLEIGVLDKAPVLGGHCLSGAIVDPRVFGELFPDVAADDLPFRGRVDRERVYLLTRRRALRLPKPPTMRNRGCHVASICEMVRWLGGKAEALGVQILAGQPAAALLMAGDRVVGARTAPAGLDRDGRPGPGHVEPADLRARVTVLAEGARGPLTQAWLARSGIRSPNPQVHALGVKELWQTPRPPDGVIHTVGWPLPPDTLGGSFLYPMGEGLAVAGVVVGLDYPHRDLDPHGLLQTFKGHRFVRRHLEGGALLEWGARIIPEGGYFSLPERLSGPGLLVVGDAAGFVEAASLKGIHYAMASGVLAARAAHESLAADGPLDRYDDAIRASFIHRDLYRRRHLRPALRGGLYRGALKALLMTLPGGAHLGRGKVVGADAEVPRRAGAASAPTAPAGPLAIGKQDAVGRADNTTRDDGPPHLLAPAAVDADLAAFYAHLCPAGVYEWDGERLRINAPNCIDCKATDVLGPRWMPRESGSGPCYRRM